MSPNQSEGHASDRRKEEVADKKTGDRNAEEKDNAHKQGSNSGAVLGDMNDTSRKGTK